MGQVTPFGYFSGFLSIEYLTDRNTRFASTLNVGREKPGCDSVCSPKMVHVGKRLASIAHRILVAAVLCFALLAGGILWPEAAAGHLCAMACCIGKAPHVAGSCMHESCEVDLEVQSAGPDEQLCGAQVFARKVNFLKPELRARESFLSSQNLEAKKHEEPAISTGFLNRPCPPDCKTGGLSYSSLKRNENSASNGGSPKATLPLLAGYRELSHRNVRELQQYFRPALPRGPPGSLLKSFTIN
jgi:hypothetical protein